jgi:hypothetical protein
MFKLPSIGGDLLHWRISKLKNRNGEKSESWREKEDEFDGLWRDRERWIEQICIMTCMKRFKIYKGRKREGGGKKKEWERRLKKRRRKEVYKKKIAYSLLFNMGHWQVCGYMGSLHALLGIHFKAGAVLPHEKCYKSANSKFGHTALRVLAFDEVESTKPEIFLGLTLSCSSSVLVGKKLPLTFLAAPTSLLWVTPQISAFFTSTPYGRDLKISMSYNLLQVSHIFPPTSLTPSPYERDPKLF